MNYIEKLEQEKNSTKAKANMAASTQASTTQVGGNRKEQRKIEAARRQQRTTILKPLQDELEELEGQISEYESAQTTLTGHMSDPSIAGDAEKMQQASSAYKTITEKLEAAISRWGEVSDAIEKAEAEL